METITIVAPQHGIGDTVLHSMFSDMKFTVDKRFYLESADGELGWRYYLKGVRSKQLMYHAVRENYLSAYKPQPE